MPWLKMRTPSFGDAVQTELRMNREDHSRWRYLDDQGDKGTQSIVVQTDAGSVKRLVQRKR